MGTTFTIEVELPLDDLLPVQPDILRQEVDPAEHPCARVYYSVRCIGWRQVEGGRATHVLMRCDDEPYVIECNEFGPAARKG